MNNIITDVKSLELETLKNLKHSKAKNTIRAYESDYKSFSLFCLKNGLNSLPAEPLTLSLYLTYLSKTNKRPPANTPLSKVSSAYLLSIVGPSIVLLKKSVNSDSCVTP